MDIVKNVIYPNWETGFRMYMTPSHDVSDKINQNLFTIVENVVFIKTWTFNCKCQTLVMQVNNNTLNSIVLQGTIFMLWNGNVISISIYTRTITPQTNQSVHIILFCFNQSLNKCKCFPRLLKTFLTKNTIKENGKEHITQNGWGFDM